MATYLVTGCAGFIGAEVSRRLLSAGHHVVGIDDLNDYYSPSLKKHRLSFLRRSAHFRFFRGNVERPSSLRSVFNASKFAAVFNLAARAGVRASIQNPFVYLSTNTLGTLRLLEACREHRVGKFVLASTSSLYADERPPFRESMPVNKPISPYAATKKGAEAMAHVYHHLYGMDVAVLRYFTVYGPAGRPDMSYFKFTKSLIEGKPLTIFGDGKQTRDFTYVDDIARGTVAAVGLKGFHTINLGGHRSYRLTDMIRLLERYTGRRARLQFKPFHPADMKATRADVSNAKRLLGWRATVTLEEGLRRTVEWFLANPKLVRSVRIPE